ncbi:beta-ketoacyl synthase [Bipolaris maydis]|nr:beta-ketoacyl synthase [Bipolaris maydis]
MFKLERSGGKAIAIIGSGCRFLGHANTPSKLWELLENPKDVSSPLLALRFHAAGFYHRDSVYYGYSNVKDLRGYFLLEEGVERKFDANFFGINNAEANVLNPQMRLLLEVTYEALENAGIKIESL